MRQARRHSSVHYEYGVMYTYVQHFHYCIIALYRCNQLTHLIIRQQFLQHQISPLRRCTDFLEPARALRVVVAEHLTTVSKAQKQYSL